MNQLIAHTNLLVKSVGSAPSVKYMATLQIDAENVSTQKAKVTISSLVRSKNLVTRARGKTTIMIGQRS